MEEKNLITAGDAQNYIKIQIENDLVIVDVCGAPDGDDILKSVEDGLTSSILRQDHCVLVDATHFTGAIDWKAIKRVSEMRDWNTQPQKPNPVAFVHQSKLFTFVVKVIGIFYPSNVFAVFQTRAEALEWIAITNLRNAYAGEVEIEVTTHYEHQKDDR
jgi:hypothetical protein